MLPDDCGFDAIVVYAVDKEGHRLYLPNALEIPVSAMLIDVGDAVRLISYIFFNGLPPDVFSAGDANCDGLINLGDPIYIINHIFRYGPPICCLPDPGL